MIVRNGRARLAVEVSGGGPPDVLLLHAGVTDQRSWAAVRAVVGGARTISFDARSFGATEYQPEDGWSPVADAVAVLGAVGSERAVVVGASMGGRTALGLALDHPERVAGLVLIGSSIAGSPPIEPEPGIIAELDRRGEEAEAAGDLEELNRIEARFWLDGPLAAIDRVGGPVRELFSEMNARALAAPDPGEQAPFEPQWPRLEQVAVPTLVLVGEHDLAHIHRNGAQLAAHVPHARLVELPGVAHLPHLEADPATLEAIADFVGEHA